MGSLRTLQLADIPAALLPVRQNILPALPKPAPTAAITLHSRLAERAVLQPHIAATLAMPLPAVAPKPVPTRVTSRPFLLGKPVLNLPLLAVTLATKTVNQCITTIINVHPVIRGKDVTTVNYIKQPVPMEAPAPAAKR